MQHRILIGINTQVGKTMLIFRPAMKNECRSEENYSWSAKLAIISNGEHCLQRTAHRCFLLSFGSFGQVVSEEKNLKNQPIRNKSHLWRPCLLTDRDEISNLYRGPSIDASYHLAKRFQRRRFKKICTEINGF